ESYEVGEVTIAEDHLQLRALGFPEVRLVGFVDARNHVQRSREYAVVARGPAESSLRGQAERFIGNRAFGRPQAHRRDAQHLHHVFAGAVELDERVLRVYESARQTDAGMRDTRDIGI